MSQNSDTKESMHSTVVAEVASRLGSATDLVKGRLVDALVERELVKRVDLLDKGMAKLRELQREVNKVRPKKIFDAETLKEVQVATLSAEEAKVLRAAREKVTKLETALEKAFAGQEFDKLASLVAGKESPSDSEQSE